MSKLLLLILAGVVGFTYFVSAPTISDASADKTKAVTFTKDIAHIFQQKCQQCHHVGGIAPMSLVTYQETRPWARSIKEKVISRQMPPFHASGPLGYYLDDPRLTDEEIATISAWVDNSAPKGNPADQPPPRKWSGDWHLGKPDLILSMSKPYTTRTNKADDYELFVIDHQFTEDMWIRGVEIHPGNRAAVHHVTLYSIPPDLIPGPDGRIEGAGAFVRGGTIYNTWVPGLNPRLYDEGYGAVIPKGTRFALQIHYAPSDKAAIDQTSVGFHFADGLISKQNRILWGGSDLIDIQPGDANYQLSYKKKFKTDALIKGFTAHMHLRGKSWTIRLYYPDGKVETVFNIPSFNFNWQRFYRLVKPIPVPNGTIAEFIGTWDNSANNRYNPDPTQVVVFGENTSQEMMSGFIQYEIPGETLNVRVEKGRRVPAPAKKEP